ncbi:MULTISPECIES: heme o synthase [Ureibacillus]|jgi:heme o synthase|uniref:Protoheme IX farnesyltransferase n=1 Tax=Ureibacillus thermosphaericus TaxID=51173 RepID=A0A840PRY3_URETH|nr:heme o synthase [Ureibacillus thermosphaericus]MBB5147914.1 protoheme IX farnesyltransferase [Ureibacillus thermosphaericus]NKZ30631.1 protoheme IX farnesyltransferase [Ureibacillus thermosphaericus]
MQNKKIELWKKAVKTGIIKSNLIPMFAALMLALYTYHLSFIENIPNMIFALIGSAAVIGAAGIFNNIYDHDIDAKMSRTKLRPSVTGEINLRTLLIVGILLLIIGLGFLALTTLTAAILGFLGVFFYVVPYTMWTKRRTIWNTEVGSISGAVPPLIGWAAVAPTIWHPACWALFIIMIIWQMPHFYALAIRKKDDYAAAKIPMLPVVKGVKRTYIQTNVYLILLMLTSFLFVPLSWGLTLSSLMLGGIWLWISLVGYRQMDGNKWANKMFGYSLIYMTAVFATVIIYAGVGMILR